MLEVYLLGSFKILRDGQPVEIASRPAQALLAYLLLNPGQPQRREKLAGLFWPEADEANARSNLRHALWRIRKTLEVEGGPIYVEADDLDVALRLQPGDWLDVAVLQCGRNGASPKPAQPPVPPSLDELLVSVQAYGGELLPGFYDEWVVLERQWLQAQYEERLQRLLAELLRRKRWAEAAVWSEKWIALGGAPEPAFRVLMLASAAQGNQAGIAAAYQRCREALRRELNADPDEQTLALYEQLSHGGPQMELANLALAALRTSAPLTTGTGRDSLLRGYQLGERIGEGGFGSVFRAIQPAVEREVAIKIIQPRYANHPDFIRRFEAEARLVARLEHPHIVPLYDYWREPGAAYLVMRLLRGGSLRADLEQHGAWEPAAAVRLLDQISEALAAAHRQNVVHRDIKPENILLDEEHNAYLSDFGIASVLDLPERHTEQGAVYGSLGYLAPEQLQSQPATPACDQYGLGVVMYELLAGSHPFQGDTPPVVLVKQLTTPLPSLQVKRPELPAALDPVLQRATDKDPARRYPDVLAFAAAFRGALRVTPLSLTVEEAAGVLAAPNPYKGLRAFQEADAADFYGRAALVERLLEVMGNGRLLAVVGPSGSGKSSVVKAGLIPALRRGALPGSEKWYVLEMTPGTQPFDELEIGLWRLSANPQRRLNEELRRDRRGILRVARMALPDANGELLLAIDQFEELFTLTDDRKETAAFLDALLAAVSEPHSPIRVVLTLRADFYDKPLSYAEFGAALQEHTVAALPLNTGELRQAICEPAGRYGAVFETGLVEALVNDVKDQPGMLPLLQYALTELYECRGGQRLTCQAYQAMGGVSGVLGKRAEQIYAGLGAEAQAMARQVFLRLVSLGEGVQDTRRKAPRAELMALALPGQAANSAAVEQVIEAFGAARLLSFDREVQSRQPVVEVAHEALLREWPRLMDWLDAGRADIRGQRLLAGAAGEWLSANEDPSFLLRGARLAQFEEWRKNSGVALNLDERRYLEAGLAMRSAELSAEAERQKREARLKQTRTTLGRALVTVLLVGLLIAAGLSVYAFSQRQEAVAQQQAAQKQSAILLASQSEAELKNGYYDRAVLLGLEALENYPYVPQAEQALGHAVSYNRALQQCTGFNNAASSVAWSPDGTRLAATGSTDNQVRVWDPNTCRETLRIDLPNGITGNLYDTGLTVRWSPDGQRLLVLTGDRYLLGSQDYDLLTYDVATGKQLAGVEIPNQAEPETGVLGGTFTQYPSGAGLDISADGRLASLGGDNTAIVWDADLQKPALVLSGHENDVNSVAWSPDGTQLATASLDGTARTWDSQSGKELLALSGHDGRVNAAAWSPDGARLATGGEDGKACTWDSASGKQERCIETGSNVRTLAWAADGQRLATGSFDGAVRLWQVESGKLLETLRGHDAAVAQLAFAPDGQRLASADHNGRVRVWNAAPSTAWLLLPYQPPSFSFFTFTRDGRYLAGTSGCGGLCPPGATEPPELDIWDLTTRQRLVQNLTPDYKYNYFSLYYSPDDSMLMASGGYGQGPESFVGFATIYVFDAWSGKLRQKFESDVQDLGFDTYRSMAWSPDSSQVAAGTMGGKIDIWDVKSGKRVAEWQYGDPQRLNDASYRITLGFNWLEWSPDGTRLAAGSSDGRALVYDTRTWRLLLTLIGHEPSTSILSIRWSPDGTRLLTGAGFMDFGATDNTARIWDAATGKELLVMRGHTAQIFTADWSPDGQRVVTGSADGTARVWDATTGDEVLSYSAPAEYMSMVNWSPDGGYLFVDSDAASAALWRVWQSKDELLADAHKLVFRQLSAEERQKFGLPPLPDTLAATPAVTPTPAVMP